MSECKRVKSFLKKAEKKGYDMRGSVFKMDYSSSGWNMSIWLRPADYVPEFDSYNLPGICIKSKDKDYEVALGELMDLAYERLNV